VSLSEYITALACDWMANPVSLQSRVTRLDNAEDHGGKRLTTELIVWHATAGDRADSAMEWMNSPHATASYHYLIDKDGTVYRFLHPDLVAYHAGVSQWPNNGTSIGMRGSLNSRTLGVSFANDDGTDDNPDDDPLTKAQVESGLWLGRTLMSLYAVPPGGNVGHCEVSPGRKTDPLPRILDMAHWRRLLSTVEA
jgi:N-acetylmuramoyl-L-alanine amidase